MALWDEAESINDITEERVRKYFESAKGIFITKYAMLWTLTAPDRQHFRNDSFTDPLLDEIAALYPFPGAYDALRNPANEHMVANMMDDIQTSGIIQGWCIFEQLIKNLPNNNYAHAASQYSADFKRNVFGFTAAEKNDLELIYYIRNAIVHYNGAYNTYKEVDHTYHGYHFQSIGNEGERIEMNDAIPWHILCDLAALGLKAWTNWRAANPPAPPVPPAPAVPPQAPAAPPVP